MIGALIILIGVGRPTLANAQALPATPHIPDLLGLYPGMPLNEEASGRQSFPEASQRSSGIEEREARCEGHDVSPGCAC
jgi:hypothetical protein